MRFDFDVARDSTMLRNDKEDKDIKPEVTGLSTKVPQQNNACRMPQKSWPLLATVVPSLNPPVASATGKASEL
jgi:hypothetical protein